MLKSTFQNIVLKAVESLPKEFKEHLSNIDIVIEDWPTRLQLRKLQLSNKFELLGLYEGVPITERNQGYNLVLPDKITIFQKPIENQCSTAEEIKEEVIRVVKHEIAHYFGLSDETLDEIENKKQCHKEL